jgi:prolyl oligopeptidase
LCPPSGRYTPSAVRALPLVAAVVCACGHPTETPKAPTPHMPQPQPKQQQPEVAKVKGLVYPTAKVDDVVDDYHGTKVADPYRWLEDVDSADTLKWVAAENEVTFGYLATIPIRDKIKQRLTKLWDYERYGAPEMEGGRYFYFKNDGLQNQAVLYWAPSLADVDTKSKVLLDPNTLSADGTVALSGMSITEDGKRMAYGLSASGSDWQEWHVRDVESGKDLDDKLEWIKFSGISWTKDGKGFYYSRYDAPADESKKMEAANYYQKLYFHKLGDAQTKDELIYKRDDEKEWSFGADITEDGAYLILYVSKGTDPKNQFFYKELTKKDAKVVELVNDFANGYQYLANDGPIFFFKTDLDAPRGRIISVDLRKPDRKNWKEIVPQAADTIEYVNVLDKDKLVVGYLKDAHSEAKIFTLAGKLVREVELPGLGSAGGFGGRRGYTETFYSYTSYTVPTAIYRYDMKTGKSTIFKQPKVDFDPSQYETKQVFYESKDKTKIPLFITYKKGIKLDGSNPTYLYGYGGFDISLTPAFSSEMVVWLEMGGVYAVANLRGGGEYGEEWHKAGTKQHKQNVFDDFIAAAEYMIAEKWTSTPKLSIGGGSNGGLLVGACLTQRPDLYGAAVPQVGVMDMLRFHKFTIGWAWVDDYGSSDDPEMFPVLRAYSPYHNLKKGTKYPATLVMTADHDDRVVPGHSFKFAAALQADQAGDAPVLIRIDTKAGHGAGKPTAKIIEGVTDRWAFLVKALGMEGGK